MPLDKRVPGSVAGETAGPGEAGTGPRTPFGQTENRALQALLGVTGEVIPEPASVAGGDSAEPVPVAQAVEAMGLPPMPDDWELVPLVDQPPGAV